MTSAQAPTLMSGVPELVVLQLLARREMYGYEIARSLKIESRGALDLGEGVLYPALHSLEERGLLRSRSQRVDGRTRIYYCVTPRGRRRLERLVEGWRHVSAGVERILGAPSHE
ncbi:MAG: helix-turn-helix transcriptional regulator [Steroidobacteraceae bacterium]